MKIIVDKMPENRMIACSLHGILAVILANMEQLVIQKSVIF